MTTGTRATPRSGLRWGSPMSDGRQPNLIGAAPNWRPPSGYPLTDAGNAERFAAEHRNDLRFVPEWGKWIQWNGTHWERVDSPPIKPAIDTIRRMAREASEHPDRERF